MPFVISVAGFKDTGKTSLCRILLKGLRSRGVRVAYFKHCSHEVLSPAGTDTGSVRSMGIDVAYAGTDGVRIEPVVKDDVRSMVDRLFPDRDVVIVEGAKETPLARIWVGGPETLPPDVAGVLAYYGEGHVPTDGHPLFAFGEEEALVDLVETLWRKAEAGGVVVMIDGRRVPVKDFVADFIQGGIAGMLKALKGVEGLEKGFSVFCRGAGDEVDDRAKLE